MRYAFLAIRQAVQERPAHADALGTGAQSLDYVGASAHAAVEVHFAPVEYMRGELAQFEKGVEGWWRGV